MSNIDSTRIEQLVGCVIESIEGLEKYSDEVVIHTDNGKMVFNHVQDCCETVTVEDFEIGGDLAGATILSAEEVVPDATGDPQVFEGGTWTFYKIETTKGELFIRWLGESNGYYSESVDYWFYEKEQN